MPSVSAPPLPVKLWHCAQLVRKSSPPLAMSAPSGLYWFLVGHRRTGAERGDVRRELVDLGLRVDDLLLRDLRAGLLGRHTAGADLEVDGRGADAHQARTVGGALTAGAVAAGAADGVELLALLDGEGLGGVIGLRLARGRERGVQPPGGRQREE